MNRSGIVKCVGAVVCDIIVGELGGLVYSSG